MTHAHVASGSATIGASKCVVMRLADEMSEEYVETSGMLSADDSGVLDDEDDRERGGMSCG